MVDSLLSPVRCAFYTSSCGMHCSALRNRLNVITVRFPSRYLLSLRNNSHQNFVTLNSASLPRQLI